MAQPQAGRAPHEGRVDDVFGEAEQQPVLRPAFAERRAEIADECLEDGRGGLVWLALPGRVDAGRLGSTSAPASCAGVFSPGRGDGGPHQIVEIGRTTELRDTTPLRRRPRP